MKDANAEERKKKHPREATSQRGTSDLVPPPALDLDLEPHEMPVSPAVIHRQMPVMVRVIENDIDFIHDDIKTNR